ncbi:MAG: hypothetical protein O3C10_12960 [Chloroflexi bacterium]|nr:hypothetical protein [Chloroflexota bacterium]
MLDMSGADNIVAYVEPVKMDKLDMPSRVNFPVGRNATTDLVEIVVHG